jgi:hypothetical protein
MVVTKEPHPFNLTRIKSKTIKQETLQFAGIEILSALAQHNNIHWKIRMLCVLRAVKYTFSGRCAKNPRLFSPHFGPLRAPFFD